MVAVRRLSMFAASGGVASAVAITGWPAIVLILGAAAMTAALVGWVINDRERPERLALLIRAVRHHSPATRASQSRSSSRSAKPTKVRARAEW